MKVHEEVFLSSVRNSLWDTQVKAPDDFKDWSLAMRLAKTQAMEGAMAKGILDSPELMCRLKPESGPKLEKMLMNNVIMHSMADSAVQAIVSALRKAGIESVLLKGQGLAAYYPHPEVRDCGDIDLYVGADNYRSSYEVLKNVADRIDDVSVLDYDGKHYHAMYSGISIEVHIYSEVLSSRSRNRIYQRYASEGLSKNLVEIPFGEVMVSTPADDFNAFFIFCHLWNHFVSSGVGMRQVCDWTMFLHERGAVVNKAYLRQVLTDLGLMKPWKTFGFIAVNVLGLASDKMPFYETKCEKKAMEVLQRILTEGDMGRETEFIRIADRGYLYEKLFSFRCHVKRFYGLLRLFPRHALLQFCSATASGVRRLFKTH